MALANVISLESGTNFILNVAAAQLSNDVTEKDFTVLHNGVAVSNVNYNKTTPSTLTYIGASLPSTTIEIRRKTSFDQATNLVTYANRFTSDKWNEALLRIQRWEEEVDLNGAGSVGAGVIPIPANDPYGAVWTNDTIYPATRKALWDKIETLAPKTSPTFTGVPVAPTAAVATSTTQLATTAFVKNVLGTNPTITNPTVTNGAFTSPSITTPGINGGTLTNSTANTLASNTISTAIATTQFVQDWYYNEPERVIATSSNLLASGIITLIPNTWTILSAKGGAGIGGGGWVRVGTSGWFRVTVNWREIVNIDYNYLTLYLARNSSSGFIDVARMGTIGAPALYYPQFTSVVNVFVTWEDGVDKIFSLRFQHNNAAPASRTFTFDLDIEKLSNN